MTAREFCGLLAKRTGESCELVHRFPSGAIELYALGQFVPMGVEAEEDELSPYVQESVCRALGVPPVDFGLDADADDF
jgi:hypothetical protein